MQLQSSVPRASSAARLPTGMESQAEGLSGVSALVYGTISHRLQGCSQVAGVFFQFCLSSYFSSCGKSKPVSKCRACSCRKKQ